MLNLVFNKKFLGIVALVAVLALAGCGGASSSQNNADQGTQQEQQQEQQTDQAQGGTDSGEAGGDGAVAFDEAKAKETYQASCAGCHGQNLEGGFGDPLDKIGSKMDANAIYDIIKNGRGQMPAQGQVSDDDARNVAEWLASLK